MKWRFDNEPAELTYPELLRKLADMIDEGLVDVAPSTYDETDVGFCSTTHTGAIGCLYEVNWIKQLIAYQDANKEL